MIYLTKEDIISINKDMIFSYGGIFYEGSYNIKNDNSFEFLLKAPFQDFFGVNLYPNVFKKAASYLFYIIKDHIFCDGNKRTGMMSAFTFLDNNGIEIGEDVTKQRIVNYAERIAGCKPNIHNISRWLKNISTKQ
jgi:death-on-curing protein